MVSKVVVDGDNYYHYCKYKDTLDLSIVSFGRGSGIGRWSNSSSHSLIKPKPTTAITTSFNSEML